MAKVLTTTGIVAVIQDLIKKSTKELVLVSPFVQIPEIYIQNLVTAANRGIEITLVFGKDKLGDNEYKKLATVKNIKILYYKNLHAKCYFNESKMIISSMNLYDYSIANNRELGVLIYKDRDTEMYKDAYEEVMEIIQHSTQEDTKKSNQPSKKQADRSIQNPKVVKKNHNDSGFCIRCKKEIEFNEDKPYCYDCFKSWNKYQNEDYEENFCHECGEEAETSMFDAIGFCCVPY